MPLDLEIIRASEFIRLGAHGQFDLAASREILRQLADACQRRGINQALLDLRDLRPGPVPMLTREDLLALVGTFQEVGFRNNHRVAVLYATDPHRRARMFAFLTTLHGGNVKAFEDFEPAVIWLSGGKVEKPTQSGGKKVPLRFAPTAQARPGQGKPKTPR